MEVCTNPDILKVIYFFLLIIDIVKIIIPIGLIIMGMIDFSKSVISNDESSQKKNTNLFIKRIIYAILVFAVPWIVEVFIETLGELTTEVNYADCIKNTENITYYEQLAEEKEIKEQEEKQKELEEQKLNSKESSTVKSNTTPSNSTEGTFIGQKYNLSSNQLRAIAMLCQREQGTAKGAAAEASLMANRFELYGSKYGQGADGLYNYVRNAGWWANAKSYMDNTKNLRSDVTTAVHEVLIQGKRTLPLYVDEHDCSDCGSYGFDIIKIITNGQIITNTSELVKHSNYKQDKTVIYNKYGAEYTFYTFPTETSDPFGYTANAKNKYNSLNK